MTCTHRINIAAYTLGVLEPSESERMREHLATCQECRAESCELSGLPVLLSTLTPADVENIVAPAELPDDLCDAVIAKAAAHRRKHAWYQRMLVTPVALVLLAGGLFAGRALSGGPAATQAPPAARIAAAVRVSATDPKTHVHGTASLTSNSWGTEIRLELSDVRWGQQCMLIVSTADGHHDTAATWTATYHRALVITGASAIPARQIHSMDVVTTSGVRLIALHPTH